MENKKELTPEKEAEEWLVKVRGYEKAPDYEDWCFWRKERDGTLFIYLTDLLSSHDIFVSEVVKVMEGLGFMYCIEGWYEFSWLKDKEDGFAACYNCKIIDHNWPLAAIKAAKQTPEIRKIMEEYDETHLAT